MWAVEFGSVGAVVADGGGDEVVVGGEPFPEERLIYWNFVASDKADIEDAKQRWESDAFAHVPGETERIPLPSR